MAAEEPGAAGASSSYCYHEVRTVSCRSGHFYIETDYPRASASVDPLSDPAPRQLPHYPPDPSMLSFDRYDHRRITARDLMVHRIMADYMNPNRVQGRTYDKRVSGLETMFDRIKDEDRELGMHCQVLRKMLFTSEADVCRSNPDFAVMAALEGYEATTGSKRREALADVRGRSSLGKPKPREWGRTSRALPRNQSTTVGDQVLDLVMRHYLETDDSAFRSWIILARTPRPSAGPRNPARTNTSGTTRAQIVEAYDGLVLRQLGRDRMAWQSAEQEHLASFREDLLERERGGLYDGGAFQPTLWQVMDQHAQGMHGARRRPDHHHWTLSQRLVSELSMPIWPERDPHMRFFLAPAWCERRRTGPPPASGDVLHTQYLDMALEPGRGRNRDGTAWTTGQDWRKLRFKGSANDPLTGRQARRRARYTSEPPPGSFGAAKLPTPDKAAGYFQIEIRYPRMTLAQLDRRSRRRSLSRTRVEEMFDWDLDLSSLGVDSMPPHEQRATAQLVEKLDATLHPRLAAKLKRVATTSTCKDGDDGGSKEAKQSKNKEAATNGGSGSLKKGKKKKKSRYLWCENCFSPDHPTAGCNAPCGHCGSPSPNLPSPSPAPRRNDIHSLFDTDSVLPGETLKPHLAPHCPVAKHNRCKCIAFPTFHTAKRCRISCRRPCGNTAGPPGSFGHMNAMTCKARCCMCGLKGHSGKECRLRRCKCGEQHLGQDCSWKPECRVKGCGRYLCSLHCQDCLSTEKPFVGRRCMNCLSGNGEARSTNPNATRGKDNNLLTDVSNARESKDKRNETCDDDCDEKTEVLDGSKLEDLRGIIEELTVAQARARALPGSLDVLGNISIWYKGKR